MEFCTELGLDLVWAPGCHLLASDTTFFVVLCTVAGITPSPHLPNPQTFNHILSPLIDELTQLDPGVLIPTHQFWAGWFVQVKLLCVYGDVLATRKVVVFASHSVTEFCSFFHAEQAKISEIQLSRRWQKAKIISSTSNLKKSTLETAQGTIPKATGVQWSELNCLLYWDPSCHVVLGVMHNWIEGILQGHFCYQWKLGWVPPNEAKKKHPSCQWIEEDKANNDFRRMRWLKQSGW